MMGAMSDTPSEAPTDDVADAADAADEAFAPPTVDDMAATPVEAPVDVPVDGPYDGDQFLLGISFTDAYRAQEFLTAMTRLQSLGHVRLRDAVLLAKDDDGDVRVRETLDPQPGRSALSGAVWSGLLGLLVGGPVGWLAGLAIGGGVGAATAKIVDLGVPDEWVEWFRGAVREGTTTVVVLAEDVALGALEDEVRRFAGAELVHSTLPAGAIADLEAALADS